jgi:2-oxoadipate dehydrogenase E1 component
MLAQRTLRKLQTAVGRQHAVKLAYNTTMCTSSNLVSASLSSQCKRAMTTRSQPASIRARTVTVPRRTRTTVRPALQTVRHSLRHLSSTTTAAAAAAVDSLASQTHSVYGSSTKAEHRIQVNNVVDGNLLYLVQAYRDAGHLKARLDPLARRDPDSALLRDLSPERYNLNIDNAYNVQGVIDFPDGRKQATLREIIDHLEHTYCKDVALDVSHMLNHDERDWLYERLEGVDIDTHFTPAQKRNFHTLITQSAEFDEFLSKKFISFKRYGLQGAESAMVSVNAILARAAKQGVEDVVIGMPHRGRLNMLVSLFDYPARALFRKIQGNSDIPDGMDGLDDVPSHIAQSVTKSFDQSPPTHVSLVHNPSHLEAVNAVVVGKTRAKQVRKGSPGGKEAMCLQLHGDAAFAGQGISQETLLLARLQHFTIGGSVHLIVNNQLGFTTPPINGRSGPYSSDIMKMIYAPVIHVNAENPEAVAYVSQLAVDYRNTFGKDILIDVVGYRLYGHNEIDEPSFTQPTMYEHIRKRKNVVELYGERLKEQGLLKDDQVAKLRDRLNKHLSAELDAAGDYEPEAGRHFGGHWSEMQQATDMTEAIDTGADIDALKKIGKATVDLPDNVNVHHRLKRMYVAARNKCMDSGEGIDWATAEALAWGSLLTENYNVHITGQDVERGTFSHRHGVLVCQTSEGRYTPLNHLEQKQGTMHFAPSPLAEFSVLGFEYGYSAEDPNTLAIWEAQFGDFFNGAQIIIDQFISSGEPKWLRQSGLVMMLPHGFDGAGPEHSSCRMERFLQLCDGDEFVGEHKVTNMIVAQPTTPANYFHLLRRQMLRKYRKPLIIVAPKTLLRHSSAVSTIDELAPGTSFVPVIDDDGVEDASKVKTVVLVSGKLHYDIVRQRADEGRDDFAVVRLEELCPFPYEGLKQVMKKYSKANKVVWAQEEHSNAGAWSWISPRMKHVLKKKQDLVYVGRNASPQAAVGVGKQHKAEVEKLMQDVSEATRV